MNNVRTLRDGKHFALELEIASRVKALVMEYEGRISLVSALGILELVKAELMEQHNG